MGWLIGFSGRFVDGLVLVVGKKENKNKNCARVILSLKLRFFEISGHISKTNRIINVGCTIHNFGEP